MVETNKLGPKFNIHTYNAFGRVKLTMDETINISIGIGLGKGISQSDCPFFVEGEVHVELSKVLSSLTSRCQPSFWVFLYTKLCYS
jgi:hypothetical protein